jgi:hypothetical protein
VTQRQVERVKKRHEGELLSLDGVQGVGIGDDDQGQPAIMVYVEEGSDRARRRIPARLENVPVVVEESEPFAAY